MQPYFSLFLSGPYEQHLNIAHLKRDQGPTQYKASNTETTQLFEPQLNNTLPLKWDNLSGTIFT